MKKIVMISTIVIFIFYSNIAFAETVRIVSKIDGTIAIIHPAPNSKIQNETDSQWLIRVFNKAMVDELAGRPYVDMDVSLLPKSREFRNAWALSDKNVVVDPQKKDNIDLTTKHKNKVFNN